MIRAPSAHVEKVRTYGLVLWLADHSPASRFAPYKAQHVLDRDFKKVLVSRSRGARQGGDACVRY
jgi:hypothetical protein